MKKALITTFFALLITYSFLSCEKDDICADETPTTPGVVIEFYDKGNRTAPKPVTALQVIAVGMEMPVTWDDAGANAISAPTITIPLKTDEDTTSYRFINLSNIDDDRNEDIITFTYVRNQVYVSRACGYKNLFYLNGENDQNIQNPLVEPGTDGSWIDEADIEIYNVENENEAHVKIYF